jgi:hypothetical protein
MAKKSMVQEAVDATKSVAGAALGAAAIAATGVVITSVAGAIRKGGKQLDDSTPQIQRLAAETVTKPLLPKKQKRSAARRKAKSAKKKVAAKKTARKRRGKR